MNRSLEQGGDRPTTADIVVVGAGNAAMCSALSAAEQGARVIVLERAPRHHRGGNGVFTGGFLRFAFDGLADIKALVDLNDSEEESMRVGRYTAEDFFMDVAAVTDYRADPDLVDALVNRSFPTAQWLKDLGVTFLPSFGLHPRGSDGKAHFAGHAPAIEVNGGGAGLVETLHDRAAARGIEVLYETRAIELVTDDGRVIGVRVRSDGRTWTIAASAVVLASGGFEANPELRARYLGPGWDLARVRGAEYNRGDGISMASAVGAELCGNWSGCHAAPLDVNAPLSGDRTLTDAFTRRSYYLGVMVNNQGERFVDEGADFEGRTYSTYAREILRQPNQVAYQIFDARVADLLRPEYSLRQTTRFSADSIEALAEQIEVDASRLTATIDGFNDGVGDGTYDPTVLDGLSAAAIHPPKSNWARAIIEPPFTAYPVTCGITFTFGGVRINSDAQVMHEDGHPIAGLFAAGEMVGGLFWGNYPTGCGIMSGAVFGRTAGSSAARALAELPERSTKSTVVHSWEQLR